MRGTTRVIACAVTALIVAMTPAHAQRTIVVPEMQCVGPADNPWLTHQSAPGSDVTLIDTLRVFPVPPEQIDDAVLRLAGPAFVRLDDAEVAHFLGKVPDTEAMVDRLIARAPVQPDGGIPPSANGLPIDWNGNYAKSLRGRLRPYLVRGVLSGLPPVARWHGDLLSIESVGIGCGAFTKLPVIVYLEREPAAVIVAASAIL